MLKYFDFEKEVELIDKSIVENETISKNSNEKNEISHRRIAFMKIAKALLK